MELRAQRGVRGPARRAPTVPVPVLDWVERVHDPVGQARARSQILDVHHREARAALDEHLALGRVEDIVQHQVAARPRERAEVRRQVRLCSERISVLGHQRLNEWIAVAKQEVEPLVRQLVGELEAVVDVAGTDPGVRPQPEDDVALLEPAPSHNQVLRRVDVERLIR